MVLPGQFRVCWLTTPLGHWARSRKWDSTRAAKRAPSALRPRASLLFLPDDAPFRATLAALRAEDGVDALLGALGLAELERVARALGVEPRLQGGVGPARVVVERGRARLDGVAGHGAAVAVVAARERGEDLGLERAARRVAGVVGRHGVVGGHENGGREAGRAACGPG